MKEFELTERKIYQLTIAFMVLALVLMIVGYVSSY